MESWPKWLKVTLGVLLAIAVVAFSQVLLYLDKMGANKFDL